MKFISRIAMTGLVAVAGLSMTACGQKGATFSILADEANFQQNREEVNSKVDVLWIVDNSGSMDSSQQNLAENVSSFIRLFNQKGFDYRLAVTTSDSYKVLFGAAPSQAKFKDGTDATSHTGVFVIDPQTPNLDNVFYINAMQGVNGSGDERVFQSIEQTLKSPLNEGFPREGAFLAVIILSDEDDFSHDGSASIAGQYSNAALHSVDKYVSFLDQLTGATEETRSMKYNVNSITIRDQACLDALNAQIGGRRMGIRYQELSNKTNGVIGSLCDDFAPTLANISSKIVELITQFPLDRTPNPDSIVIHVDGVQVPVLTASSPQPWNGYRYHADSNSISFHGSYVPGPGAQISIKYDPTSIK